MGNKNFDFFLSKTDLLVNFFQHLQLQHKLKLIRSMWKKIQIQHGASESVPRYDEESVKEGHFFDDGVNNFNINLDPQDQMDESDFLERIKKEVDVFHANDSKLANEESEIHPQKRNVLENENKNKFLNYPIKESKSLQQNQLILVESHQVSMNKKYYDLQFQIYELKQEQKIMVQYIKRKLSSFKFVIQENMNTSNLTINDLLHSFHLKKESETSVLEERVREQQTIIKNMKTLLEIEKHNYFIENQALQTKLTRYEEDFKEALEKINRLQNSIAILQDQNNDLEQKKFDFQQKLKQMDLQILKKVQEKVEQIQQKQINKNRLIKILQIEEQIQKISEKQYQILQQEEYLEEKQQKLTLHENHLEQRQKKIKITFEKLQKKSIDLKLVEENLEKKTKHFNEMQNQIRTQIMPKRIDFDSVGSKTKLTLQQKNIISQRNYFSGEYQISSKPIIGLRSVQRPKIGNKSRIIKDILQTRSGSKKKSRISCTSRINPQSPSNKNIVENPDPLKIHHFTSKLEILRKQIKKEIEAVKS